MTALSTTVYVDCTLTQWIWRTRIPNSELGYSSYWQACFLRSCTKSQSVSWSGQEESMAKRVIMGVYSNVA